MSDIGSEPLGKRCFACANVACYYDSLSHFLGRVQGEAEEFFQ
jgi:hypothetical protein